MASRGRAGLGDHERRRDQEEAWALLTRGWQADDVDDAVRLHDLLETPDAAPDPAARELRQRLIGELSRLLEVKEDPARRVRRDYFAASLLDDADLSRRRLALLRYRGFTNVADFQNGAEGQLDAAIEAYDELIRLIAAGGPGTAVPASVRHGILIEFATACFIRYDRRRELLQLPALRSDHNQEIRADLNRAVEAAEQAAVAVDHGARAAALMGLGLGYRYRYEDDERYHDPKTIDNAISLLRQAVRLAEANARHAAEDPAWAYQLRGIRDRLAGALATRDTLPDVDAAIALYQKNLREAPALGLAQTAGEALSLATAYMRRWGHTKDEADREQARAACAEAFAIGEAEHLPSAFDIAAQWGGLAWTQQWWDDAGAAYQAATEVMHLAVRQQGSRADRDWVVRKAPGVAARAAFALARCNAADEALVTLETGRAVLLTEMFDRRALDYQRIVSLAGQTAADDYQRLTDELTRLEAELLLVGPAGEPPLVAAIEQARKRRSALRSRLPREARSMLSELDGPPHPDELRHAAGPATVVYLDATAAGGLALILRPGGGSVEQVELAGLTPAAVTELAEALEVAVQTADAAICADVCRQLWPLAMEKLLPRLRDTAEVVLIPSAGLSALPWHAAQLPGRSAGHVLDHIAISYMPNIRSLPVARAAWGSLPRTLRALAIEAPEPTRAYQLQTADEIAAVLAWHGPEFRVTRLPGTEATKPRLRYALSQFEVLHFSGHSQAAADPLEGGLLLAYDEFLTIRELLTSGVGGARFAVLSACETARVEELFSDEMVSLPTALLQCGFGGVVGSLWSASDKPAVMLMKAFYREWRGKRGSPAQALRSAQQWTRDQRYASPLAWANFVYIGP